MAIKNVPVEDLIVPRCTASCPAGVDVPRYIRAVRNQKYDEALAVLREKLPLPTVCADACFAPCEDNCAYRQFGDPIAIRAIKRAATDGALICLREYIAPVDSCVAWPRSLKRDHQLEAKLVKMDRVLGYTFVCAKVKK